MTTLVLHRAGSSLAEVGLLCLRLVNTLGEGSSVLISSILGLLGIAALQRDAVTLVLETLRSNQTLDLWCLGVWLLALTLWLNLATDNELADIVILGETEESTDLGGTLGSKTLWVYGVGNSWNILFTLLHNAESENRKVHGDNASTD